MMDIEDLNDIQWSKDIYKEFKQMLITLGEEDYKAFNQKIIPDMGESIGVRTPTLKKISKNLSKNKELEKVYNFLEDENTYEEKIIQGMLLPNLNYLDSKDLFNNIDLYILRIHNWALCDSFVVSLKGVVNSNKESFFVRIKKYIRSSNPWEIRFGLVLLNNYFTDKKHIEDIFLLIKYIENQNYYVEMAMAWLISTCYFVDRDLTLNFINSDKLNRDCKLKSLRKMLESKKITEQEREQIKKLKASI